MRRPVRTFGFGLAAILFLPVAFLLTPSAYAAEVDSGPVDIELPPMLAPMTVANRLEAYAYLIISLAPAGRDKVFGIREKVPFIRDAFVRELNKGSIVRPDDPKAVDVPAVIVRLTERTNQVLGPGAVAAVKVPQVVVLPLEPQS